MLAYRLPSFFGERPCMSMEDERPGMRMHGACRDARSAETCEFTAGKRVHEYF